MCLEMVRWFAHCDDYLQRRLFTLAINNPGIKRDNAHAHTKTAASPQVFTRRFSVTAQPLIVKVRFLPSPPRQSCFWGMQPSISTTSGHPSYLFVSLLFFMCCWNTVTVYSLKKQKTFTSCFSTMAYFSVLVSLTLMSMMSSCKL